MKRKLNTPYDDVFRTLVTDAPELIISLINEIHGTHFTGNEEVTLLQNEEPQETDDGTVDTRITDSYIRILDGNTGHFYHIECQSTSDGTIILRIFEYGTRIARTNSSLQGDTLTVNFPDSSIMALRSTENTPDVMHITLKVPGNRQISYDVPVLKVKEYTKEQIFEKRLYILIPFHIFRFEMELPEFEKNAEKLELIENHYASLMHRLIEEGKAGKITEYSLGLIEDLSETVIESIAYKYNNTRKGLGETMRGQVLDYPTKRLWRQMEAAQKELDDIQRELDDAHKELDDAHKELDDAKKGMAVTQKEMAETQKEKEAAIKENELLIQQLNADKAQLEEKDALIEELRMKLETQNN